MRVSLGGSLAASEAEPKESVGTVDQDVTCSEN